MISRIKLRMTVVSGYLTTKAELQELRTSIGLCISASIVLRVTSQSIRYFYLETLQNPLDLLVRQDKFMFIGPEMHSTEDSVLPLHANQSKA